MKQEQNERKKESKYERKVIIHEKNGKLNDMALKLQLGQTY